MTKIGKKSCPQKGSVPLSLNMEAVLMKPLRPAQRFGLYKNLGWQPITAKISAILAADSEDMACWLASFWYAQPCPSLFVETNSMRSSGKNVTSILSILLVLTPVHL